MGLQDLQQSGKIVGLSYRSARPPLAAKRAQWKVTSPEIRRIWNALIYD